MSVVSLTEEQWTETYAKAIERFRETGDLDVVEGVLTLCAIDKPDVAQRLVDLSQVAIMLHREGLES